MKSLLLNCALTTTLLIPTFISQAEIDNYRHFLQTTDRIVVYYKEKPTEARALAFIKQGVDYGGYGVAMGKRKEVLEIGAHLKIKDANKLAKSIQYDPQIKYVEPDLVMTAFKIPNDPLFHAQWHFFENTAGINLPTAWDISTGDPKHVVAVIDTGITKHREINNKILPGYDFISNPWMANDGDSWDNNPMDTGDAIQSGDCGSYKGTPVPKKARRSSWHGTHVTGTIAANTNDGNGVAGIVWSTKILPVRALGRCGGYTSDIVSAMRWAAGLSVFGVPANPNPAKVINLSLGGYAYTCPQSYQDAINEIVDAGITIVVAAGNAMQNADLFAPANCDNVITVGAINRDGNRSWYSNYGNSVNIMAPGGETHDAGDGILSTHNSGLESAEEPSYAELQGTSMAAPHVSGLIALSYAVNSNLTPQERKGFLMISAREFGPKSNCDEFSCGSGIADGGVFLQAIFDVE